MKVAFLFPGQGSQKVGMGKALVEASPQARELFQLADDSLGFSLSKVCFEGPESELQLTAHTQPAILTASVAAWRFLDEKTGLRPSLVAGHSLGEYSALVAAGALDFADAVRIVHLRGRFMQEAVPAGKGAMAAIIGLDARAVEDLCREAASGDLADEDAYVAPANFNGAGQVVVAGAAPAVARAVALAKGKGAKLAKLLPVSAPFHCRLMAPAAERLAVELARTTVKSPSVPVVTNVEAAANTDGERVRDLLTRQVTAPVRWEESVRFMSDKITHAVEIGPGKVLTGLVKRIAPDVHLHNVEAPGDVEKLAQQLQGGA